MVLRNYWFKWKQGLWGRGRMVVGFTITYAISDYYHSRSKFESRSCWGVLDTTLCDTVCHWLATGRLFSPGTPIPSTNKTVPQIMTEILLKVVFNTVTQTRINIKNNDDGYNLWVSYATYNIIGDIS